MALIFDSLYLTSTLSTLFLLIGPFSFVALFLVLKRHILNSLNGYVSLMGYFDCNLTKCFAYDKELLNIL